MGNWEIDISTPKNKNNDLQKAMKEFFGEDLKFMSREDLNARMDDFVYWYNNIRKQPDTGKTPAEMSKEFYGTETPPLPDKIMVGNEEMSICEAVYALNDPHKAKKLLKANRGVYFIGTDEEGLHFAIKARKIDSSIHIKGRKLKLGSSTKGIFDKHRGLLENILKDCIKGEPKIKIESAADYFRQLDKKPSVW